MQIKVILDELYAYVVDHLLLAMSSYAFQLARTFHFLREYPYFNFAT